MKVSRGLLEVFNSFTDEEIELGINMIHDSRLMTQFANQRSVMFVMDFQLGNMAFEWLDCGKNRTMLYLKLEYE